MTNEKEKLVLELEQYHKKLSVPKLHNFPNHKESKDWIANVAAIFKQLDESDYQKFQDLQDNLYLDNAGKKFRTDFAHQIDRFVRQKVAEYKRYDFGSSENQKSKTKKITTCTSRIKLFTWLSKNFREIIVGLIVTVLGGLVLYYIFGIK